MTIVRLSPIWPRPRVSRILTTMACKNLVQKKKKKCTLRRQNAYERLPDILDDADVMGDPNPSSVGSGTGGTNANSNESESNDIIDVNEMGSRGSSVIVIDVDKDEVTVAGVREWPSTYSVVSRNRVYPIPDEIFFSDAQHRPECGCFYCRLLYPAHGHAPTIIETLRPSS